MAERKSEKKKRKKGKSPDPYMRAFLRQAAAIIATERGLNDASNAKLKIVAERIGLSKEAFESAIQQLKKPENELGLIQYERKFSERLNREFKKISGDVLTIRSEGKLLDLAADRYQIDPIRAHQLIQKVAEKHKVGTISHSDAEQFARQLVADTAYNKTQLTAEETERLYHVCKKWGFEQVKVDRLLSSILINNKWKRRRAQFLGATTGILLLATIAGIAFAIVKVDWEGILNHNSGTKNTNVESLSNTPATRPEWWNGNLDQLALAIGGEEWIQQLVNTDERQPLYIALIENAIESPTGNNFDLVKNLYIYEPNDANANSMIETIAAKLNYSNRSLPASSSQIRESRNSCDLLEQIYSSIETNAAYKNENDVKRIQSRKNILSERIGDVFQNNNLASTISFQEIRDLLYLDQWNHAVAFCQSHPESVAGFLNSLEGPHRPAHGYGILELRTRVAQCIVEKAPLQWQAARNSVAISVKNCNDTQLVRWAELLERATNSGLSEFLTNSISTRINAENKNQSQRTKRNTIAKFVAHKTFPNFEQMLSSKRYLEKKMAAVNITANKLGIRRNTQTTELADPTKLPQLIGHYAQTNNLLLIWNLAAERKIDITKWEKHFKREFNSFSRTNVRTHRAPTSSEVRRFDQALDRLTDSKPNEVSARISAVEELQELAERFHSIDRQNAVRIVEYMFRKKQTREQLAVERALPNFGHWLSLKLAIADRIEENHDTIDEVLNLISLMDLKISKLDSKIFDWRKSVQKELLKKCITLEESRVAQRTKAEHWNELQFHLDTIFSERLRLLRAPKPTQSGIALNEKWLHGTKSIAESHSELARARLLEFATANFSPMEQILVSNSVFHDLARIEFFEESVEETESGGNEDRQDLGHLLLNAEMALNRSLVQVFKRLSQKVN